MHLKATEPYNEKAVATADEEIYRQHEGDKRPNSLYDKDGNRKPLDLCNTSHGDLREEWMRIYKREGGEVIEEKGRICPTCEPVAECPEEVKIVAVEFLNGDKKTELSGTGKHFVNLPRDNKWVDGTHVSNIDRLNQKTRFKVRFNKPEAHKFKVKYVPGGGNVAYSNGEKGRNNNFKFKESEEPYTTEADGTKIVPTDFFVTAAGKDTYKLLAEDEKGNKVESNTIETHRLVYYQEIKMKTVAAATNLSTLKSEFANHNIKLVPLASVEMEHMPNIGKTAPNNSTTFKNKARSAYNGSKAPTKKPYVVAVGYTDHLAVKDSNQPVVKSGVDVGPGKPDVEISIAKDGKRKYLWKGLVPGEGWFVSAMFVGSDKSVPIPIPVISNVAEANCTAIPRNAAIPDRCDKVKVKVSGLTAATGSIILRVNWVNRFRGGLSFGGGNLICVCTRAFWSTKSNASQNQTMIHEMGHKVGMVADGTGKGPDKVNTLYDTSKGHVGNHCHKGIPAGQARYDSSADLALSTCVMYGATNGKSAFCDKCAPAVRKQDLNAGWSAF